jgi:hypothetical protein
VMHHGKSGHRMQDLGQRRFHARALSGREHDGSQRRPALF